ncbi:MAG TPA: MFS transporter, partial [Actinomycetota bacterium]|nr:MFS transporter [Actinomycetota bacterium]
MVEQRIGFCTSRDGVRIAYAVHGSGPPIVRPSTWLTHLERDWRSPLWRHWLEELGRANTVVRYDERGCGLSDRDVEDLSPEAWLWDLEAVVEATGLDAFDLVGGAGVGLLSFGSLAGALAPTLTALGLAQVPVGVGLAAVLVGAVAAAGEWPSPDHRTRVLAWTLVGQPVAWVVGMPVVGAIAATAGWRPALVALPVSASVPALVALRRAPAGRAAARSRDRRWLLQPPVARWALGEVLAFSAWSATLVYAGTLFAVSYGAGPAQVGLVLGA